MWLHFIITHEGTSNIITKLPKKVIIDKFSWILFKHAAVISYSTLFKIVKKNEDVTYLETNLDPIA